MVNLPELTPGTIITLGDLSELPALEDAIAPLVRPEYDPAVWASRLPIRDRLKPAKFNGSVGDITLTVIDDPYEQFISISKRGLQLQGKSRNLERNGVSASTRTNYLGFIFNGIARSTGRGAIGSIEAELYYYPPYLQRRSAGSSVKRRIKTASGAVNEASYTTKKDYVRSAGYKTGETIRRSITKPIFEAGKFAEIPTLSRCIACKVLQEAIVRAIPTPMRD